MPWVATHSSLCVRVCVCVCVRVCVCASACLVWYLCHLSCACVRSGAQLLAHVICEG